MAIKTSSPKTNKKTNNTAKKTVKKVMAAKVKVAKKDSKVTTKSSIVKKPTAKKVTKSTKSVEVFPMTENQTSNDSMNQYDSAPKFQLKRSYIIAVIAAVLVLVGVYSLRSWVVAAVVNGQPVYRFDVINQMEQQYGGQEMQSIVTQTLIKQEASKRHITITQADIDSQLNSIKDNLKKQGQTLDAALQAQHMTLKQLDDQIILQKEIEKMVTPVIVSDQQVKAYLDQNGSSLPQGTTPSQVRQQLQQQQLQQEEQTFITGLQTHAHITSWVNYYTG